MPLSFHCGVEQRSARRAHNPEVIGSNPIPATTKKVGVAQLVEHGTHKPGVVGPIPTPDIFSLGVFSVKLLDVCGHSSIG